MKNSRKGGKNTSQPNHTCSNTIRFPIRTGLEAFRRYATQGSHLSCQIEQNDGKIMGTFKIDGVSKIDLLIPIHGLYPVYLDKRKVGECGIMLELESTASASPEPAELNITATISNDTNNTIITEQVNPRTEAAQTESVEIEPSLKPTSPAPSEPGDDYHSIAYSEIVPSKAGSDGLDRLLDRASTIRQALSTSLEPNAHTRADEDFWSSFEGPDLGLNDLFKDADFSAAPKRPVKEIKSMISKSAVSKMDASRVIKPKIPPKAIPPSKSSIPRLPKVAAKPTVQIVAARTTGRPPVGNRTEKSAASTSKTDVIEKETSWAFTLRLPPKTEPHTFICRHFHPAHVSPPSTEYTFPSVSLREPIIEVWTDHMIGVIKLRQLGWTGIQDVINGKVTGWIEVQMHKPSPEAPMKVPAIPIATQTTEELPKLVSEVKAAPQVSLPIEAAKPTLVEKAIQSENDHNNISTQTSVAVVPETPLLTVPKTTSDMVQQTEPPSPAITLPVIEGHNINTSTSSLLPSQEIIDSQAQTDNDDKASRTRSHTVENHTAAFFNAYIENVSEIDEELPPSKEVAADIITRNEGASSTELTLSEALGAITLSRMSPELKIDMLLRVEKCTVESGMPQELKFSVHRQATKYSIGEKIGIPRLPTLQLDIFQKTVYLGNANIKLIPGLNSIRGWYIVRNGDKCLGEVLVSLESDHAFQFKPGHMRQNSNNLLIRELEHKVKGDMRKRFDLGIWDTTSTLSPIQFGSVSVRNDMPSYIVTDPSSVSEVKHPTETATRPSPRITPLLVNNDTSTVQTATQSDFVRNSTQTHDVSTETQTDIRSPPTLVHVASGTDEAGLPDPLESSPEPRETDATQSIPSQSRTYSPHVYVPLPEHTVAKPRHNAYLEQRIKQLYDRARPSASPVESGPHSYVEKYRHNISRARSLTTDAVPAKIESEQASYDSNALDDLDRDKNRMQSKPTRSILQLPSSLSKEEAARITRIFSGLLYD